MSDRIRRQRGDGADADHDRAIEQRALRLLVAGVDWLTAVAQATRELDEEAARADSADVVARRRAPGPALVSRRKAPGKVNRSAHLPTAPTERATIGGLVATLGESLGPVPARLRAELSDLLGIDLDALRGGPVASGPGAAPPDRELRFAAGTYQRDGAGRPGPAEANAATRGAGSLAETLAQLDDPRVPTGFARQAAVAHALRAAGAGGELDPDLERDFGDKLNAPLGDVRIHSDSVSGQIVEALGARAFAFGRHLFFAPGAYAPSNDTGRALIAHELAHVAQQPRGEVADPERIVLGTEGDRYEQQADTAASYMLAGLRAEVSAAPVAARFDQGGGAVNPESVLRKHIGHDESAAKQTLKQAGDKRALVERIIRDSFDKERAEEIIKSTPASGAAAKPPEVKGKDAGGAKPGKIDAAAGKGGGAKPGESAAKPAGGGASPGGRVGQAGSPVGDMCEDLGINELSPEQRTLISTELAEHEAWSAAGAQVGAPGSRDRYAFVAGQVVRGFAQGAATGAVMGVAMGVVGQLAQRFCPIPGVGAMIAGGMAAYGLATRDWGATGETIRNFGTGASKWDVMANSLAAISEILDLVVNVMNVIAGILGLISAVMWLVTIITVGVAAPLAGTLSAIALGILTVAGVLDNINSLVLQPAIIACRIMHTVNSDADPREIVAHGGKIADSASKVGSAVGGFVAGRAVGAGAKRFDARRYGPGGRPGARPARPADAGEPRVQTAPAPDAPAPRAAGTPDAPAPHAAGTPDAPAPHAAGTPDAPRPAGTPDAPNAPAAGTPDAAPGPRAADVDARAAHAQRSWRQKMGQVGTEFTDHRQRVRERNIAEQRSIADAEDAAHAAKQQEIATQRSEAEAAANRAHEERVAQGRQTADEAAATRLEEGRQRANESHEQMRERDRTRMANDLKNNAQRYLDAQADAARDHAQRRAQLREQRGEADARHREAMAEVNQIKDPAERAQAQASAERRYASDKQFIDRQEAQADTDRTRARETARTAYEEGSDRAYADVRRRQETRDRFKQLDLDRAQRQADSARHDANRDATFEANAAKQRALDEARTTADGRAREPDAAARQARATAEGPPDSLVDGLRPIKTAREQRTMVRDYQGAEGGRRSMEWGDVSSKELDPGFSPGGGPAREAVEGYFKRVAGTDTSTEAESAAADSAQDRDMAGGILDLPGRINRGLLHGEHSHQQKEQDARHNAQFAPDDRKVEGERKNPHYAAPPSGSLKELDTIKQNLTSALLKQEQAAAAAAAMKDEQAAHQANEAPLDALHGESKRATEVVVAHKTDVSKKREANTKQTEQQAVANQKIDDYASRSAQFDAVITPMRGVERFTYIGSAVGISAFDDMNHEIKKTLKGFEQMSAAMKKEAAAQPQARAELAANAGQIQATDQRAAATDAGFQKNAADVAQIKQDNAETTRQAGAASAEAEGQRSTYAAKVSSYRSQYNSMAGGLLSWAQAHQGARAEARAPIEVAPTAATGDAHADSEGDADGGSPAAADAGPAPAPAAAGAVPVAPPPAAPDAADAGVPPPAGVPAAPPASGDGAPR